MVCGIFLDQGLGLCPRIGKVASQLLTLNWQGLVPSAFTAGLGRYWKIFLLTCNERSLCSPGRLKTPSVLEAWQPSVVAPGRTGLPAKGAEIWVFSLGFTGTGLSHLRPVSVSDPGVCAGASTSPYCPSGNWPARDRQSQGWWQPRSFLALPWLPWRLFSSACWLTVIQKSCAISRLAFHTSQANLYSPTRARRRPV